MLEKEDASFKVRPHPGCLSFGVRPHPGCLSLGVRPHPLGPLAASFGGPHLDIYGPHTSHPHTSYLSMDATPHEYLSPSRTILHLRAKDSRCGVEESRKALSRKVLNYINTRATGFRRAICPEEWQLAVAAEVLMGRDCFAISRTGSGKSLIFQMVAMAKPEGCVLVVCPLLALMNDQVCIVEVVPFRAARLTSTV